MVETYKRLSNVEQAFRSFKQVDLKVRPIYHYSEDRVRAHVFLCMLAYYVEFYMRKQLAPILFVEDDPCGVQRDSVVSEVKPSESAKKKARSKRMRMGTGQSFRGLLGNLGNISERYDCERESEKGRRAVLHDYEAYAIAEQGV